MTKVNLSMTKVDLGEVKANMGRVKVDLDEVEGVAIKSVQIEFWRGITAPRLRISKFWMEAPVADCEGIGLAGGRLKFSQLYQVDLVAGSGGHP